jgi:hypothetical protein
MGTTDEKPSFTGSLLLDLGSRRPILSARLGFTVAFSALGLMLATASLAEASAPSVPDASVTNVTATSADLHATIDPQGLKTTYRFEYLTEAAFQTGGWSAASFAPPSGAANYGSEAGPPAFRHIEHLSVATTYRYRAVATNADGSDVSPEHLFATEDLPSAAPSCSNDAFRLGLGAALPDCRAYELVSPIDKGGGQVAAPEALFGGGQLQAAPSGGAALTFSSATSFGAAPGAPPASQYLSTRSPAGWSTTNLSAPLASAAYGDRPDGAPYRLFSGDLSAALLAGGLPCRASLPGCPFPNPVLSGSGAPPGYMAYYLRAPDGDFVSLLSAADVAHSAVEPERLRVEFLDATPDLSHVVLSSCAALTADALEVPDGAGGCDPGQGNLYEWSGGDLRALNLLPGETKTTPGARLAAPLGALSRDGRRLYFTLGEDGPLCLSDAGAPTRLLPESIGGNAEFQASSTDGSIAYFTKGGELYRYSLASETSTPIASGVKGVLGVSEDGSSVYFQSTSGLEVWDDGAIAQIAPGAEVAVAGDYPPATASARLTPDGSHLAFLSAEELTGYDNGGRTEAYVYGPTSAGGQPQLLCASCNPTGEAAHGSSSIAATLRNGTTTLYRPRSLSSDGARLFFNSDDRLVIGDTDSSEDVYEWEAPGSGACKREAGCVALISGGRSDSAAFIDASADGTDAYFLTGASLLPSDPGSADIYDARIGGGFPEPATPIPCLGDACQPLPSPPEDPTPGTTLPNSGNPPVKYYKEHQKRHHKKRHKHHHRKHPHHRGGR